MIDKRLTVVAFRSRGQRERVDRTMLGWTLEISQHTEPTGHGACGCQAIVRCQTCADANTHASPIYTGPTANYGRLAGKKGISCGCYTKSARPCHASRSVSGRSIVSVWTLETSQSKLNTMSNKAFPLFRCNEKLHCDSAKICSCE
jgi:hypothetical protein